ncbi:MAG: pknB 8 [Planctomycetota bacterium]|nr:pknB 8 [Planctomycetota bacterium]
MGIVFLAEQERPLRRTVALKVIKPGMDTEQIVARFEAERQALALMDHPSIAKVLDAGATESGRPYFVMELVKGVPITEYCDTVHLTPRERLELFIPVCEAVQHAHQKGIIHRDIKPSNVLVAMQDGRPVPKVIDFGIAKAVDQKLTERSLFTQHGMIVGTLEYVSPEQAQLSAMDVDTRTDVYALGVVLDELLTGTSPLERSRLRGAAYSEILRRIREEEPPTPSTRLSESREGLPSVAANRRVEPARLTKLVRGELDWIVMKALEKDRTRRYEMASRFARDIRRHLDGDAVEASPPSAMYRIGKFAQAPRGAGDGGPLRAAADRRRDGQHGPGHQGHPRRGEDEPGPGLRGRRAETHAIGPGRHDRRRNRAVPRQPAGADRDAEGIPGEGQAAVRGIRRGQGPFRGRPPRPRQRIAPRGPAGREARRPEGRNRGDLSASGLGVRGTGGGLPGIGAVPPAPGPMSSRSGRLSAKE